MPTGPKGQKRPADAIGNAVKVMRIATEEEPEDFGPAKAEKSQAAVERGQKGGAARTISLTPRRKVEIAKKAASVRWSKEDAEN